MSKNIINKPITAILLDRDGTIIEDSGYLCKPELVKLLPQAAQTLHKFINRNIRLFIVTNQSGIGRGYYTEKDFLAVQTQMLSLLAKDKVYITETFFCPHSPDINCSCRKPNTQLWDKIKNKYNLSANQTLMIGDKDSDISFAHKIGLRSSIFFSHNTKDCKEKCLNVKDWTCSAQIETYINSF